MRTLIWLGLALLAAWLVVSVIFKVTGFVIHLLLLAAVVLLVVALARRFFGRTPTPG